MPLDAPFAPAVSPYSARQSSEAQFGASGLLGIQTPRASEEYDILWRADLSVVTLTSTYNFANGANQGQGIWLDKVRELDLIATFSSTPSGGTPASFSLALQGYTGLSRNAPAATDWTGIFPELYYNGTTLVPNATSTSVAGTLTCTLIPTASPALMGGVVLQTPVVAIGAFLRVHFKNVAGLCRVGVACTTPNNAGILNIMSLAKVY